ncbi:MAG: hypothetical protein C0507_06200 [Cyanobacteria bacterium PR.3.49]|jgi:hypothetical protein|nr:hypothetical protein [Cyanobacteria bacterium PR.3.49]
MSRSANTKTNCPACKKPNDQEMHFCIFCGTVLNAQNAKRADRTCISCGRFDELNVTFCIFCGANTSQALSNDSLEMTSPREGKHTPIMATRPSQSQSVTRNRVKAVKAQVAKDQIRVQQTQAKKPANNFVWAAAGALVGLAGAFVAFQTGALVQVAKFCMPASGLAIYTEAPNITFLVESLNGKDMVIGETGPSGTAVINDLVTEQRYRLRMEGHGFETVYFQPFSIEPNNVSVLGYPKKVSLPPRHI